MNTLVTFITATIGRESLARTQESIEAQTDGGWKWIVAGDGVDPPLSPTAEGTYPLVLSGRIMPARLQPYRHESPVRNWAVTQASTPYVAFVDDDDTISPHYVEWLREVIEDDPMTDLVIFRQTFPLEGREPAVFPARPEIVWGNVGISYAVRQELAMRYKFKESKHEDLLQLVAIEANDARIHFSPHVAYFGRDCRA